MGKGAKLTAKGMQVVGLARVQVCSVLHLELSIITLLSLPPTNLVLTMLGQMCDLYCIWERSICIWLLEF